jgi:hypothetical protein
MTVSLPQQFNELSPYADEWVKDTRAERYRVRLSKSIAELEDFYDAVAPHAAAAQAHLDTLDLGDLPEDANNLLKLLFAFVLVSFSVNVYSLPNVPDSGAAHFHQTYDPVF